MSPEDYVPVRIKSWIVGYAKPEYTAGVENMFRLEKVQICDFVFRISSTGGVEEILKCSVMDVDSANSLLRSSNTSPPAVLSNLIDKAIRESDLRSMLWELVKREHVHPELRWPARQMVEDERSHVRAYIKKHFPEMLDKPA